MASHHLRQEQLELWGQLLFTVQPVAEVDAADAAVGVHLDSQGLDVVGACRHDACGSVLDNFGIDDGLD